MNSTAIRTAVRTAKAAAIDPIECDIIVTKTGN